MIMYIISIICSLCRIMYTCQFGCTSRLALLYIIDTNTYKNAIIKLVHDRCVDVCTHPYLHTYPKHTLYINTCIAVNDVLFLCITI